jgi:Ca2+:H+ antiporter
LPHDPDSGEQVTVIVFDGRADLVEGAALIGLYGIIATAFWWG